MTKQVIAITSSETNNQFVDQYGNTFLVNIAGGQRDSAFFGVISSSHLLTVFVDLDGERSMIYDINDTSKDMKESFINSIMNFVLAYNYLRYNDLYIKTKQGVIHHAYVSFDTTDGVINATITVGAVATDIVEVSEHVWFDSKLTNDQGDILNHLRLTTNMKCNMVSSFNLTNIKSSEPVGSVMVVINDDTGTLVFNDVYVNDDFKKVITAFQINESLNNVNLNLYINGELFNIHQCVSVRSNVKSGKGNVLLLSISASKA